MTSASTARPVRQLKPERLKILYTNHRRGAAIRIGASCVLWFFALLAYKYGSLKAYNIYGLSITVAYIILINPVVLFVLRFIKTHRSYDFFSILINQFEIMGYTAVIYFAGGIEAVFLSPLYAALIAFIGVAAPRRHSYIVAFLCLVNYAAMIGLTYAEILPQSGYLLDYKIPLIDQVLISAVVIGLLFVISYLSAATAGLIRAQRNKLHRQYQDLAEANTMLKKEIVERTQAEHALRKSEYRYRNILESIDDGYYECDLAGNFTFFNDAFSKMLGYTKNEVAGSNYRAYMDSKTANDVFGAYSEVYRSGKAKRELEWNLVHKDGSQRFGVTSISLIEDENGNYNGFRGLIRDTTEFRSARMEREELKARLQRAQKMEAIGTLAGGVAHDLNNILSGLTSYPELLLMKIDPDSPLKKPLLTIKKSGEKAAAVVQDLLTLARRGVDRMEPANLNTIVAEYLESPEYEKLLSFHPNVLLESIPDPLLNNVMGSPIHLLKTVMNLVSNAAEAMPDGGKIEITTCNMTLASSIKGYETISPGDYVSLVIKDTGEGASEADMERIFEPFYTKKKMGRSGTGLGMAVVWGTVKDHKGFIDIQSGLGKGMTISLYIPMTRTQITTSKLQLPLELYKGSGETILVVDDVFEQREVATGILSELNYKVASVGSGEEALEWLKTHSADLLVLDMLMGAGIDGLDTYRQVLNFHPSQKAVIASGFSETERVKKAMELGVGQYIKKPYSIEKIGFAIREELNRK